MKKLILITLLIVTFLSCQKEEHASSTSLTPVQAECAESAQEARKALESNSDIAFDLSGSGQSTGCSIGASDAEVEF
jgi:hypothetical protein